MLKILVKTFPLIDHLYIFQLLEYNIVDFFKWFSKYPLKRDLQRKNKLQLTSKMQYILFSCTIWLIFIFLLSYRTLPILGFILILIFISLLTPILILLAHFSYLPVDYYFKTKKTNLAKSKLKSLSNLKIVAITGSYGKTSTKEMLNILLWKKFLVVKTPKSFNTPMGVAETIIEDLKENSGVFIAEIGAYKKGDIAKLAKWIKPDIGIITAIAPQHLERFGSLENIAKAKWEIVENIPKNGLAILNSNSKLLHTLASHMESGNTIFYGPNTSIYASDIKSTNNSNIFTLNFNKQKININLPLVGEHHITNFLAATTAALSLGLTLKEIQERSKWILPTSHRLEIRKEGDIAIIDNSYNTNPTSARASLELLKNHPGSLKILITPGLIELGNEQEKENEKFSKDASKVADKIIIVGETNKKPLLKGLRNFPKEHIHQVKSTQEGFRKLTEISKPNAVALIENDLPDQYF